MIKKGRMYFRRNAHAGIACRFCGYDLAGLSKLVCPECGKDSAGASSPWPNPAIPPRKPSSPAYFVIQTTMITLSGVYLIAYFVYADYRFGWNVPVRFSFVSMITIFIPCLMYLVTEPFRTRFIRLPKRKQRRIMIRMVQVGLGVGVWLACWCLWGL